MTDRERKKLASKIVRKILEDLLDRRGFRQTWDGCDEEVKKEIRETMQEITARQLKHTPE